jgi:ATP phosphoribosyltransferase
MNTLRIAIQKSGRLQEDSLKLLKESGLSFSNGRDQLKTQARNFPVEILFLRDDDIPQYIEDNVADAGIVGENVFIEKQKKNDLVKRLDFAKCRLSIAIPRSENYTGVGYLEEYCYLLPCYRQEFPGKTWCKGWHPRD